MHGWSWRSYVASIRSELEATTATAAASEAVLGEQVAITMGDSSVLKGQLAPAKVPFVSGYGTIEIETSAITSFAEGRLSLEDGSVLKGGFGEGDVAQTTSQGALRIPAREIVAIKRSGTSEPASQGAPDEAPALVVEAEILADQAVQACSKDPSGDCALQLAERLAALGYGGWEFQSAVTPAIAAVRGVRRP